ncbi:hypothetical protein [Nocardia rhizosphaerae]|uniref:Uncharacterized protein n=1 Tax=Nocardia rhizosphaerae TaxID=1691571 RepID=A0ABV8L9D9_9NOCA
MTTDEGAKVGSTDQAASSAGCIGRQDVPVMAIANRSDAAAANRTQSVSEANDRVAIKPAAAQKPTADAGRRILRPDIAPLIRAAQASISVSGDGSRSSPGSTTRSPAAAIVAASAVSW